MAIHSIETVPAHILAHAIVGLVSVALGAIVLFRRKGTPVHRILGRTWVALMYFIAIGSFWIQSGDHLSWIHGLSSAMIITLTFSVWAIRSGNVKGHRIAMTCAYIGLCVTAAFTLLPYRFMGQLVF
jgi:uncharacterized membrane protein